MMIIEIMDRRGRHRSSRVIVGIRRPIGGKSGAISTVGHRRRRRRSIPINIRRKTHIAAGIIAFFIPTFPK